MITSETVIDRLKLLAAALVVLIGVFGVLGLSLLLPQRYPAWLIASPAVASLLVFLVIAMVLFNGSLIGKRLDKDGVRKLESEGLIVSTAYRARRAFEVDELDEEGLHFFIELDDRSVLFLSGQYLYDYHSEDQHRTFLFTAFAVRRHRTKGWVVDILCQGAVLEPEVVAPPFDANDFGTDSIPGDGQIITDKSYDHLKDERMACMRAPAP
jgi:hypothetical protein